MHFDCNDIVSAGRHELPTAMPRRLWLINIDTERQPSSLSHHSRRNIRAVSPAKALTEFRSHAAPPPRRNRFARSTHGTNGIAICRISSQNVAHQPRQLTSARSSRGSRRNRVRATEGARAFTTPSSISKPRYSFDLNRETIRCAFR